MAKSTQAILSAKPYQVLTKQIAYDPSLSGHREKFLKAVTKIRSKWE